MSGIDDGIKLYIKEQIDKIDIEVRKKNHKIANDLTVIKFSLEEKLSQEREKNDKRYSPSIVGKIVFTLVGLILSGVFGAILKLVIIG